MSIKKRIRKEREKTKVTRKKKKEKKKQEVKDDFCFGFISVFLFLPCGALSISRSGFFSRSISSVLFEMAARVEILGYLIAECEIFRSQCSLMHGNMIGGRLFP